MPQYKWIACTQQQLERLIGLVEQAVKEQVIICLQNRELRVPPSDLELLKKLKVVAKR